MPFLVVTVISCFSPSKKSSTSPALPAGVRGSGFTLPVVSPLSSCFSPDSLEVGEVPPAVPVVLPPPVLAGLAVVLPVVLVVGVGAAVAVGVVVVVTAGPVVAGFDASGQVMDVFLSSLSFLFFGSS